MIERLWFSLWSSFTTTLKRVPLEKKGENNTLLSRVRAGLAVELSWYLGARPSEQLVIVSSATTRLQLHELSIVAYSNGRPFAPLNLVPNIKRDLGNTVDGRNPFRTTWNPCETVVGWYVQGNHHSRVS